MHALGLDCVHTAPRPRAQRVLGAVSLCTGRRVAGHALQCSGHFTKCMRAGAPCRIAAAFAPGHDTKLYRNPIHATRTLQVVSRARPAVSKGMSQHAAAVSQHCIASLLRYIATQQSPLNHETILYRDYPWPSHARARCRTPSASRPYRGAM